MRTLAVWLAIAAAALGQEQRPRHNASYVPDDDETVRGLIAHATEAADKGATDTVVDALQSLLGVRRKGVVPVRGRELFVSPRRWATLVLLSQQAPFGKEILEAWRKTYAPAADSAIRGALERGSQDAVLALVRRYPAAPAAPAALLALADRALLRGDRDAAMGFLLRAPEHVPAAEKDAWLATPAYRERHKHLIENPAAPPKHWPTLGGANSRARSGDALPAEGLKQLWETPFLTGEPTTFTFRANQSQREHSPLLPFYPVFDKLRIYVHLGTQVAVFDRPTGALLYCAPGGGKQPNEHRIESMLATGPGLRAATISNGILYFAQARFLGRPTRHNNLIAFDTARRSVIWSITRGPGKKPAILRKPIHFRGAPAVSGGRVYVYGAVKEESEGKPSRKEEAYLFCFDARKGDLIWHRFLGYGDTDAAPDLPPQSGLAPALRNGVVVAVTGLGVCAAMDAQDGEVLWMLRYDRNPGRERARLTESTEQQVHVRSGWFREAPRIVGDMVFLAPMDSDQRFGCWLRGYQDGTDGQFYVQQWAVERSANPGRNSLLEQVAGISGDRIYYVGRRDERAGAIETYQTIVSNPLRRGEDSFAYARIPAIERSEQTGRRIPPEVFGRAAIAGTVLLVPTRRTLFRFDVAKPPATAVHGVGTFGEIPPLPLFTPKADEPALGVEPAAMFGTLVPLGGRLYAVTAYRIVCYGK